MYARANTHPDLGGFFYKPILAAVAKTLHREKKQKTF
jgi:hypothetical protein